MKLSVYNEIVEILPKYRSRRQLHQLTKMFPGISLGTIGSIFSQEYQKKMKRTHYKHKPFHVQKQYYEQFCAKAKKDKHIIISMANKMDLSPCMLARIILEQHLLHSGSLSASGDGMQHSSRNISSLLRNPHEIPDPDLAVEIQECVVADEHYGPIVDSIKRSIGVEYEKKLKEWCHKNGVDFLGEDQMRWKGYDKTPDIKLEVPIAVDGHVINWIESKASFGDEDCHEAYLQDQFWSYWNSRKQGISKMASSCESDAKCINLAGMNLLHCLEEAKTMLLRTMLQNKTQLIVNLLRSW
ncbi:uncharacterized protein C15orf41 homolog isoform X3 [Pomacea canaliculata]|uniref:uncharacterized protein C15orf41 homolog isoform X3 n=1 Tax=Pomacea canaliculata TaxID=400727 RepID=UPI000D73EF44|nr:uncharacterized protein C15orf41 homolog isoform X3 [Pomacea canaliculata]